MRSAVTVAASGVAAPAMSADGEAPAAADHRSRAALPAASDRVRACPGALRHASSWGYPHGQNSLHTRLLWPPEGFSTLWMTTIPVLSLLALPLTLTAGPLVAYNVLVLLALPLAAGAAYLLCRELTGRFGPALMRRLLFGLYP